MVVSFQNHFQDQDKIRPAKTWVYSLQIFIGFPSFPFLFHSVSHSFTHFTLFYFISYCFNQTDIILGFYKTLKYSKKDFVFFRKFPLYTFHSIRFTMHSNSHDFMVFHINLQNQRHINFLYSNLQNQRHIGFLLRADATKPCAVHLSPWWWTSKLNHEVCRNHFHLQHYEILQTVHTDFHSNIV